MHRSVIVVLALLPYTGGCDSGDTSAPGGGIERSGLRGSRYCEVLLAFASPPGIHVEVYNTIGLNDCPDEAWHQLDANQIKAQYSVALAILNGPRYWMIDAFVQGELVDNSAKTFGTIDMHQAASIDLPLEQATMVQVAYTPHQIQRETVVRFDKEKPVFELVDPTGQVFDMQSYSIQKIFLTQDDLETLGSRLELPVGWTFRTRTLAADLLVTAIDNLATVVQDDFANTYQLSQQ